MKKVSIKTFQALTLLDIIAGANLGRTTTEDKTALIKLTVGLRGIAKEWNELVEETRKRCRPEGFDEVAAKYNRIEELPEQERGAVREAVERVNAEMSAVLDPEYNAERVLEVPEFDDGVLARLADSNPEWNMSDVMSLRVPLIESAKEDKEADNETPEV